MTNAPVHLRADGVSIVLTTPATGLPAVRHWGAALGDDDVTATIVDALERQTAPATLDAAWNVPLLPAEGDGWAGRPGIQVTRDGVRVNPRWTITGIDAGERTARFAADDADAGMALTAQLEIVHGGLVRIALSVRNTGDAPLGVDWLEPTLPVPSSVTSLTTLDGRWSREKRVVRTALPAGAVVRQSRRGRPGHDHPTFFAVSEGEAAAGTGRVWLAHAAWSGDTTYRTDRLTEHLPLLGAGELLAPGEIVLAPGEEYAAPTTCFAFSPAGIDGAAALFHTWLRSRETHPTTPRPFTLNTWEAVYFDQDPAQLRRLADRAADVGVERFVLDDGWFTGRRDDTTSLGDWDVDAAVWPEGLRPLADHVHARGMQFGLWFEPEMISLDSDLARRHPEWMLHDPRHLSHDASLSWRTQFVLDLAEPAAWEHVLGRISALVAEIGIDYIKWDHNRDLVESAHDGRPGVHAQTVAVHRMIAELKRRHPGLEIESCSSGGARTDLGMMDVCDRVWASDSNDPVERLDIQRWTGVLLPPELVGAHVGPPRSHSSGRVTDLSYRFATSLLGSAGLEWDILSCDEDETAAIARFAALYKELRPLIHAARTVHPEMRDDAWRVTAFVDDQATDLIVVAATVAGLEDARAERLRLPVDPDRRYRVRVRREIGAAEAGWVLPPWFGADEVVLGGGFLREVGLQLPTLWPLQAFVVQVTAV